MVKKQRRLIVAKYKENVNWINDLTDDFDIIVYNKDNNLDPNNLDFSLNEYYVNV